MWGLLWKQPAHPAAAGVGGPSGGGRWHGSLLGWVARLGWTALLVWLVLRKLGLVLVIRNPLPLCAWRVTTTEGWDMGWSDAGAAQHVMVMYLNKGEEYAIESPSLPYARLFSVEAYGITGKLHGILRDAEIVPQNGPNVYRNVTAAANGEQQGGYRIHITAQGNRNLTNELPALGPGRRSGLFVLVFRLVDVGDVPHPRAPLAHLRRGGPDYPERWGWAPAPALLVRRVGARRRGKWREIPACEYQPDLSSFNLAALDRLHDRLASLWEVSGFIKPNRRNNMHLQRAFKFNSNDLRTLGAAADIPMIQAAAGPDGDLWARVAAKLPRTPRSLYAAPFIANASAYDVRYVAFTSASRAFPLWSYETLTDKTIRQHYQNKLKGPHEQWDGRYVLWIGPPGAPVPKEAQEEDAIVMAWGEAQTGGPINYPVLLVTQRLAQSQLAGFWDDETHPAAVAAADFTTAQPSVANVMADQCPMSSRAARGEGKDEAEDSDDEDAPVAQQGPGRERVCCGDEKDIPEYCFMPEYLHLRLRQYYPAVTYFVQQPETEQGSAQLRKLAV